MLPTVSWRYPPWCDQERIIGLSFIGGTTNLTHDHLDYHISFKQYGAAKKAFDGIDKNGFALINIDDKNIEVMLQNCEQKNKQM